MGCNEDSSACVILNCVVVCTVDPHLVLIARKRVLKTGKKIKTNRKATNEETKGQGSTSRASSEDTEGSEMSTSSTTSIPGAQPELTSTNEESLSLSRAMINESAPSVLLAPSLSELHAQANFTVNTDVSEVVKRELAKKRNSDMTLANRSSTAAVQESPDGSRPIQSRKRSRDPSPPPPPPSRAVSPSAFFYTPFAKRAKFEPSPSPSPVEEHSTPGLPTHSPAVPVDAMDVDSEGALHPAQRLPTLPPMQTLLSLSNAPVSASDHHPWYLQPSPTLNSRAYPLKPSFKWR
jgi:hypothetical protein